MVLSVLNPYVVYNSEFQNDGTWLELMEPLCVSQREKDR